MPQRTGEPPEQLGREAEERAEDAIEHVDEGEQAAWAVRSNGRRSRRTLDEVGQTGEAASHDRANDTHGKSEEWMGRCGWVEGATSEDEEAERVARADSMGHG